MMRKLSVIVLFLFFFISCDSPDKRPEYVDLTSGWSFRNTNDSVFLAAKVPGTVHTDLLYHNRIPDPFIGSNESDVQWVAEATWEYKKTFNLDEATLQKRHIELHFDGIDTYAQIRINDSLVLSANNAFRKWVVDIKSIAKKTNTIQVIFDPTTKAEAEAASRLPYELPEGERIFTRKPQFQYGWDWGPKLNTFGLIKEVYVKSWDVLSLEDLYVKQEQLVKANARLNAAITLSTALEKEVTLMVFVNDRIVASKAMLLTKGKKSYDIPFTIKNPKLWWTHNLGDPYLYSIRVEVLDEDSIYASKTIKKGIRTVNLITEKDEAGTSFYFELNGTPVFMKGANYIPQHSFQTAVGDTQREQLLNDVVAANMNMLRVWGGGVYEDDVFYDLCDAKGILIWQDFMFACAMYPGDKAFLENVKEEATQQVRRLRNHASIALWCGNNESAEGWHRWGWQSGRSSAEKALIWADYKKLFQVLLPEIVAENTATDYWESSPKYGRGNPKYISEGDAHDWWVWHDAQPFEHYETAVPRFMSEFGFQSYPSFETIAYFTQEDQVDLKHPAFDMHQKHDRGFALLEEYMRRDYNVPKDDPYYVYVSQLVQARGIIKGIEAHRRAMPYCMGSLYWQLNDCWPAISWSSIDGFGHWKALHYKAKNAFENVLISPTIASDTLQLYLVNDKRYELNKKVTMTLYDFDGKTVWTDNFMARIPAQSSVVSWSKPVAAFDVDLKKVVLQIQFNEQEKLFYFVKPKALALKKAPIAMDVSETANGYAVALSTTTLQKDVFIQTDTAGFFENNFIDILPNKPLVIFFRTKDKRRVPEFKLFSVNGIR